MKKAVIAAAVLAAILAGLAFFAYNRLDLVVKVVLEYYGPDVTGVTVKVGDVEISPRDGRGNRQVCRPAMNPHRVPASVSTKGGARADY